MSLRGLLQNLQKDKMFESVVEGLKTGLDYQAVTGVSGALKSLFLAGVHHITGRPVLAVTQGIVEAKSLVEECDTWLGPGRAVLFPPLEVLPYEVVARSGEMEAQRVTVMQRLAAGESLLLVAPVAALPRKVVPPEVIAGACVPVREEDMLKPEDLSASLARNGYERLDIVEGRGQFAFRGGILDVFPPANEFPLRIEFSGDRVQSIREFDPSTQRSTEARPFSLIGPPREFIVPHDIAAKGILEISRDLEAMAARLESKGHRAAANRLKSNVRFHVERMESAHDFREAEQYLPYSTRARPVRWPIFRKTRFFYWMTSPELKKRRCRVRRTSRTPSRLGWLKGRCFPASFRYMKVSTS